MSDIDWERQTKGNNNLRCDQGFCDVDVCELYTRVASWIKLGYTRVCCCFKLSGATGEDAWEAVDDGTPNLERFCSGHWQNKCIFGLYPTIPELFLIDFQQMATILAANCLINRDLQTFDSSAACFLPAVAVFDRWISMAHRRVLWLSLACWAWGTWTWSFCGIRHRGAACGNHALPPGKAKFLGLDLLGKMDGLQWYPIFSDKSGYTPGNV